MAKKTVGGGPFKDSQTRRERLSSIVSGDTRDRNKAGPSLVRMTSAALSPRLGMPVSGLGGAPRAAKDQSRVFSERTLGGLKQRAVAAAKPKGYVMGQNLTTPKPKAKPASVVRTTVNERVTPTSSKSAAPQRMAINPRTGSTLGFTTGGKTGSTASKPGTAFRTPMTPGQRASRASFDRSGVAGPQKDSSGRNRSSATGKGAFGGGKKR